MSAALPDAFCNTSFPDLNLRCKSICGLKRDEIFMCIYICAQGVRTQKRACVHVCKCDPDAIVAK